ncbi:MAG: hypothetical protein V1733_00230 [bacterium]
MKKKDLLADDFLKELVSKSSLESPSDDFIARVMVGVESMPAPVPVKKSFFSLLKSIIPWTILAFVVILFIFSSDLPFINNLPGIEFMQRILISSFGSFIASFKSVFSGKFASLAIAVLVSGVFLFAIERLISRKTSTHRQYMI